MSLRQFVLAGAIVLFNVSIAICWEVEQGSNGNELLLETKNSSDRRLRDISVKLMESPLWVHFETSELALVEALDPQDSRTAAFLFDVSQEIPPETKGKVKLLVTAAEGSWGKEIPLAVVPSSTAPKVTALHQSSPNPFKRSSTVRYQLCERAHVSLRVFDLAGRLAKTLIDEEKPSGYYEAEWRGESDAGVVLADGAYFYRLKAGDFTCTKKIVLVR